MTFYLFNSDTKHRGINLRKTTLDGTKMNANLPVKMLIHGWMDDYTSYWYQPTIEEYLKKGNVNVVTVSWGKHSKNLVYPTVVKAVRAVGQHVGDMITEISAKYNVPIENFHLIGHSLGAHISGFAGKYIRRLCTKLTDVSLKLSIHDKILICTAICNVSEAIQLQIQMIKIK